MYSVLADACAGLHARALCCTPTIAPARHAVLAVARLRDRGALSRSPRILNHFYMPTVPSGALGFTIACGHAGSAHGSTGDAGIPTAPRAAPTPGPPRRVPLYSPAQRTVICRIICDRYKTMAESRSYVQWVEQHPVLEVSAVCCCLSRRLSAAPVHMLAREHARAPRPRRQRQEAPWETTHSLPCSQAHTHTLPLYMHACIFSLSILHC
jgi:hypothetical protein